MSLLYKARGRAKEAGRLRKGCRQPWDVGKVGWQERGRRRIRRREISLDRAFSPSWGKSHASRFYEYLPRSLAPSLTRGKVSPVSYPFPLGTARSTLLLSAFHPFLDGFSLSFGRFPWESAPVDPFVFLSGLCRRYARMFEILLEHLSLAFLFITNSMGAM